MLYEKEVEHTEGGRVLRLASITPERHMNVIVKGDCGVVSVTLSADGARELRDALIEVYPVEPEKHPYEVFKRLDDWAIVRREPNEFVHTICVSLMEADAKKIAQALNEAEGL